MCLLFREHVLDKIPKLSDHILHFKVQMCFVFTVGYVLDLQIYDGSIPHVTESLLLFMGPVLCASADIHASL